MFYWAICSSIKHIMSCPWLTMMGMSCLGKPRQIKAFSSPWPQRMDRPVQVSSPAYRRVISTLFADVACMSCAVESNRNYHYKRCRCSSISSALCVPASLCSVCSLHPWRCVCCKKLQIVWPTAIVKGSQPDLNRPQLSQHRKLPRIRVGHGQ